MAHYAFIDQNSIVVEVIVGIDETKTIEGLDPETWYGNKRGLKCVRTSYNDNIRKQYAGIGYTYDETADVFVQPQPYPSWTLDSSHDWQPPTPMPDGPHSWDEQNQQWVKL